MLVTIFGPDGAGKTTQIKRLLQDYAANDFKIASVYDVMPDFDYQVGSDLSRYYNYFKNFDVIHTRFRLHSNESDIVMSILESIPQGTDIKLTALSAYIAYYSYVQWNKYVLEPLLADGKFLICDKYYYDDVATKSAFGCPYKWLKQLHYDTRKPDLSFYIKVDGSTLIERNMHRADGRIVHFQSDVGVNRLLYYYEQIVQDENLIAINGNNSQDAIHSEIVNVLEEHKLAPWQYSNSSD
ncbi:MAG: hypothetical protein LIP10_09575 [Clostridiales bacterium]|nr:hypothetical protein [Clostridiales bacterium]